jgi:hypothetical protein
MYFFISSFLLDEVSSQSFIFMYQCSIEGTEPDNTQFNNDHRFDDLFTDFLQSSTKNSVWKLFAKSSLNLSFFFYFSSEKDTRTCLINFCSFEEDCHPSLIPPLNNAVFVH